MMNKRPSTYYNFITLNIRPCVAVLTTFIFLFIYDYTGSLLLSVGFLQVQPAGATLCCGIVVHGLLTAVTSHCGSWALGT